MGNVIFYFSDELSYKISKLESRSQIAQSLFEEYFLKQVKPDLKEISSELQILNERAKILEDTKTKVVVENHIQEIEEKKRIDSAESRVKSKIESIRKNASAFFPTFASLSQVEQDKLINEYMLPEFGDLNLVQFFNSKGFKDNLVEDGK